MSLPTTGVLFSGSTPAAPPGNQLCEPRTDGGTPAQIVSFAPRLATADLAGVVKPGPGLAVDDTGTLSVTATGTGGGGGGTSASGGLYVCVSPTQDPADGTRTQFILPAPQLAGTIGWLVRNDTMQRQLGTKAYYSVQGTQLTLKYPLEADGYLEYYYIQGTPNSESGGGGSVTPATSPVLRGSNIASSNSASSISVALPAGTQAGDLAICFLGHAWTSTLPAGWTSLQSHTDFLWWANVFYKILSSADITTGSVTATMSNSFDCVLGIVTFIGATGGIRESQYGTNSGSGGLADITNVTSSAVLNTDAIIYFSTARSGSAIPTITPSSGSATTLQTAVTTANTTQSILADQSPPGGVLSVVNDYPGVGANSAWAVQVVVMAP